MLIEPFSVNSLTLDQVNEVFLWNYPGEYFIYDLPSKKSLMEKNHAIFQPEVRKKEYYSIVDKNNIFCGYFHLYNPENSSISLGIGLAPVYCGKGYGAKIIPIIIQFIFKHYLYESIKLEVRSFNKRAMKCYLKNGFEIINEYSRKTNDESYANYIQMVLFR